MSPLSNHPVRPDEWQPISTAPKDGTLILTWGCLHDDGPWMCESPYYDISRWDDVTRWVSRASGTHEPTHWQPLPEPPVQS